MPVSKLHKKLLHTLTCLTLLFSAQAICEECHVAFSQPNVSFGKFRQDDIVASQKNWQRMPAKDVMVNVYCPEPVVMALFVQAASGPGGAVLFGDESRLVMSAYNMVIDGHSHNLSKTTDQANFAYADNPAAKILLKNNEGVIARDNMNYVRGKNMSFTIKLIPVINNSQLRHTSDITELESHLSWVLLTKE